MVSYKQHELQKVIVRTLDEMKNLKKKEDIEGLEILFSNVQLGDCNGIMSIFKSSNATKMKEILSSLVVTTSLKIELGNNSLSDAGLKNIFEGL